MSVLNWHDCTLPGKQLENQDDCKPFDRFEEKKLPTKQLMVRRLNRAITKIHKDDYDLSMVYIDSLKVAAKEHGPNSQQAMDALAEIDQVLQVKWVVCSPRLVFTNVNGAFLLLKTASSVTLLNTVSPGEIGMLVHKDLH